MGCRFICTIVYLQWYLNDAESVCYFNEVPNPNLFTFSQGAAELRKICKEHGLSGKGDKIENLNSILKSSEFNKIFAKFWNRSGASSHIYNYLFPLQWIYYQVAR